MNIFFDFHCHLYPVYDLRKALLFAEGSPDRVKVSFLTERYDCRYFDSLASGALTNKGSDIHQIDTNCLSISKNSFLVRGRQFSSCEGIEVLALFASPDLPEKLNAKTYCEKTIADGGLIAFSWAFGKWRGSREDLIESLALLYGKKNVLLLDSGLRPSILRLPKAFKTLAIKGFKILAGSDPLPLANQEQRIGSLGSSLANIDIKPEQIDSNLLRDIIGNFFQSSVVGQRSGMIEFVRDQIRLRI